MTYVFLIERRHVLVEQVKICCFHRNHCLLIKVIAFQKKVCFCHNVFTPISRENDLLLKTCHCIFNSIFVIVGLVFQFDYSLQKKTNPDIEMQNRKSSQQSAVGASYSGSLLLSLLSCCRTHNLCPRRFKFCQIMNSVSKTGKT